MVINPGDINLNGLIDLHIHTAPDIQPRALDDVDAAQQAAEAGMRAIVLKSHVTLTADRAAIAQKLVPTVGILGGLVLNEAVGGLNPAAVEVALRMGARVLWMPTLSASIHSPGFQKSGGISLFLPSGELHPALEEILSLVSQYDTVLATGHISVPEIRALVKAAKDAGVRKIVITHPEAPWVDIPAHVQEELCGPGVWFERCFVSTTARGGAVPLARIAADIRYVGVRSTVLATDLGQVSNPLPVQGLRAYIAGLLGEGFSQEDILLMAKENPAHLLGIG